MAKNTLTKEGWIERFRVALNDTDYASLGRVLGMPESDIINLAKKARSDFQNVDLNIQNGAVFGRLLFLVNEMIGKLMAIREELQIKAQMDATKRASQRMGKTNAKRKR